MNLVVYLNAFLFAFFISVVSVPLLRRWAVRSGYLDTPDTRKVHKKAVPRLGGVAIGLSFLFSILIFFDVTGPVKGLLVGLLIVFLLGLIDDLIGLTAKQKFAGQIAAAALAMVLSDLYLLNLGNLFGLGQIVLPFWLSCLFTIFAVVGVTNAINMIDGLDGLAGGVSVVTLFGFALLFYGSGNDLGLSISIILIGALLGFLKHNSYPANIFMGDAGSLSLGFMLAFLAIEMTQNPSSNISPAVPVLILGLPIIDTLKVMVQRKLQGKSPFTPDMTHVHHNFLGLGLDHRFTVILIYSFTFFWTLFAIYFRQSPDYFLLGVYLLAIFVAYQFIRYMRRHPQRFTVLTKDSSRGLKESSFYTTIVRWTFWLVPVLFVMLVCYLALTMFACAVLDPVFSRLSIVLLISGVVIIRLPVERWLRYEFIYYVASALLIVLLTERQLHLPIECVYDLHDLSNVLYVVIAVSVCLKMTFRKPETIYLSSPLDYLFLAMIISLVAIPGELAIMHRIPSVILKTIFLIMALRIVNMENRTLGKFSFWGVQLTLLVLFLRSVI